MFLDFLISAGREKTNLPIWQLESKSDTDEEDEFFFSEDAQVCVSCSWSKNLFSFFL